MRVKPNHPILQVGHPLAKGLILCGMFGRGFRDLSLNSYTATINGATEGTGRFGRSLDFDGVDDDVDLGQVGVFNGLSSYTMCATVVARFNDGNDQVIFSRDGGFGTAGNIRFSQEVSGTDKFKLDTYESGQAFVRSSTIIIGRWYNITVVAEDGQSLRLYVDGVEDSASTSGTWSGPVSSLSENDAFGERKSSSDKNLDGRIASLMGWDHVLTDRQIRSLALDPFELVTPRRRALVVVAVGKTATGAITLPLPTLAGVGVVGVKTATGAITLPIPTVAGVGTVGTKTATGAITLPLPTLAGVGAVGAKTATGAITLPLPTIAGVGLVGEKTATGAITLPVPTLAGVGVLTGAAKTATGAITLPLPTIAGVGAVGAKTATGALTLPVPTVAGVGVIGIKSATGALTLPVPTLAGVGVVGTKTATGALTLPVPTVAGVGQVGAKTATGALTIPIPTIAGVGDLASATKTATGAITLPVTTLAGVGVVGKKTATGAITLPITTIAGVGILGGARVATGAITLPLPTILGEGIHTSKITATGAFTLPLPTIDGHGAKAVLCDRQFRTDIDMEGNDIGDVGQVAIGLQVAAAGAILDMVSTTKGVLFPRMTTTQRDAIPGLTSELEGMVIYNTSDNVLNFHNGTAWGAVHTP